LENSVSPFVTVEPPPETVQRYHRNGWWDGCTLSDLLTQSLDRAGDQSITVHSRLGPTKARLRAVADMGRRVAAGLIARGIRPGEPVAFQLPNSLEAAAVFYGLIHLGVVLVPLSHALSRAEVIAAVGRSGARTVIVDVKGSAGADVDDLLTGPTEHVVVVGASARSSAICGFAELIDAPPSRYRPKVDPAAPAVIGWTSGSTAEPKGVLLSHRALCAEVRLHMAPMFSGTPRPLLSTSPVSHVTGMLISLLVPPLVGHDIHLMDYWDPGEALVLLQRYELSAGTGAPIFLQTLLDHPSCGPDHQRLIARAFLGGASVSPELVRRAEERGILATRGYGCTEHPSVSLGRADDDLTMRASTDGPVCAGVEVNIVGDEGQKCGPGSTGEIVTRGPDLFSGYLDPAMNDEAFHDGWYRTGDIGSLDERGYLTVLERKKDIIIRAGLNISAAEVEAVLATVPGVSDVALVAAPNTRTGEHGCAFIRPMPGYRLPDLAAIRQSLAQAGLAKYKWPEEIRRFDGEFPRTPAGKIRKADLRRIARGSA
jgi:acyl-CoA synthetase